AQGIRVNSITLFLFGGVAAIERESDTPGQAFQVAIAGPLVSITLFGLCSVATAYLSSYARVLVATLAQINLVLALFNLIPGLPLDGGQMLKAALWKLTGDRLRSVRWSARVGQVVGYLGIAFGLFLVLLTGGAGGSLWITIIGWFILRNATAYSRVAGLQQVLSELTAADVMTRQLRVVEAEQPLRQFAESYLLQTAEVADGTARPYPYYAASDGRYRGLVILDELQTIERSLWDQQPLQSIVRPLTEIPTVEEKTPLPVVIMKLEVLKLHHITVLSPAGSVAGVIDRGDIVRAIGTKLGVEISDAIIRQVKQTGSYPSDLPIPNLAKSLVPADLLSSTTVP
ncbi:MAG: site-2 protease family protein, partial [Cyanobacteria bacterium]|nr:site-2 protease family protein [Cyanobacteriota bacterium]